MTFATIASGIALADATISARGAKTCALTAAGTKLVLNVGSREDPLSTPFGATSFGEEQTDRKTVDFRLTGASLAYFHALDEWAVNYVSEHSERLFQKKYTLAQVRKNYKPCAPAGVVPRFAALQGERRWLGGRALLGRPQPALSSSGRVAQL